MEENLIIVGPKWDRRVIDLVVPKHIDEIAVFVSGGMDSAILFYALSVMNPDVSIKTFCVPRSADDAKTHSHNVHDKVYKMLKRPGSAPELIGTADEKNSLKPTQELVESNRFKLIYDGVNHQIPLGFDFPEFTGFNDQHSRGERPWRVISDVVRTPFLPLYKYHIIDLFYKLQAEELIEPTHSCTANTVGRCGKCMWCKEREWGFNQLGLTDPGKC